MFKRLVSTTVNHVPLVPCHVYTPIVKLSQQQVDKDPQVYSFIQVHAAQNHYFVNSRLQNCHCLKRWTSWLRLLPFIIFIHFCHFRKLHIAREKLQPWPFSGAVKYVTAWAKSHGFEILPRARWAETLLYWQCQCYLPGNPSGFKKTSPALSVKGSFTRSLPLNAPTGNFHSTVSIQQAAFTYLPSHESIISFNDKSPFTTIIAIIK